MPWNIVYSTGTMIRHIIRNPIGSEANEQGIVEIVQHSFLYTLFLLASFGKTPRPQQFYEDKFLTAFPMALDMFPETTYTTAEDDARRCYVLRALERFAALFGLAELTLASQELYRHSYVIGKSALLNRFVTFTLL